MVNHEIATAFERGWGTLQNGDLLRTAETEGFEAIITTDQNLKYQQNLSARRLAILVLPTTNWPIIRLHAISIGEAADSLKPGDYVEWVFPSDVPPKP